MGQKREGLFTRIAKDAASLITGQRSRDIIKRETDRYARLRANEEQLQRAEDHERVRNVDQTISDMVWESSRAPRNEAEEALQQRARQELSRSRRRREEVVEQVLQEDMQSGAPPKPREHQRSGGGAMFWFIVFVVVVIVIMFL